MSEPFIGEIKAVGFDYAPRDWAKCQGQLVPVTQNPSLYSLLSTRYGGDGVTSFALPDLRGRMIIGDGQGVGLSSRIVGQRGGSETKILSSANLPAHTHTATISGDATGTQLVSTNPATTQSPAGAIPAAAQTAGSRPDPVNAYTDISENDEMVDGSVVVDMSNVTVAVGTTGAGTNFDIMPPYLVVNYIIALNGLYPARS